MSLAKKRPRLVLCIVALVLILIGGTVQSGIQPDALAATGQTDIVTTVKKVDEAGNLVLSITKTKLSKAGISGSDLIRVKIGSRSHTYLMPVCSKPKTWGKTYLELSKSSVRITRESRNFAMREHLQNAKGKRVVISLEKKNGYRLENPENNIESVDGDRYVFANFREVSGGELAKGILFRSYSPVSDMQAYGKRCAYVNELMAQHGIAAVISLNIDMENISGVLDRASSEYYYDRLQAGGVSANRIVGTDISGEAFRSGLAGHMRFMALHGGPYLVHCALGRDRTGFVICLCEALMGASYEEIAEDYVISYRNYNQIQKGSCLDEYLKTGVDDNIQELLGTTSKYIEPSKVNLKKAARRYLTEDLGLTAEEVGSIVANLSDL